MKTTTRSHPDIQPPVLPEALRRLRLATARLALREAGAFLSASAPRIVAFGERLRALSQHPRLAAPPPFGTRQ